MKRIVLILLFLYSCAPMPGPYRQKSNAAGNSNTASNDILEIVFLDVGQGDSTLITSSPTESILIDAGPPNAGRDAVLPCLREKGIRELKHIIATHYHDDHIGGIAEVVRGEDGILGTSDDLIPTEGFIDRGGEYEGPVYEEYEKIAQNERITAHPGDSFDIGSASVEIVAANGLFSDAAQIDIDKPDENAASIVLLLTRGDFDYLHPADLTGGGGEPPYDTVDLETHLGELVGDVDVLHVAHHGSRTSSNEEFIEAIDPEIAVISVGDENEFGQPHDEVMERLIDAGADIYLTERGWLDNEYISDVQITDGPITISVNGDDWNIE